MIPIASTPPPPWDRYDAYLFDIDGTLLTCSDAVHYFAFCEALTSVAGRPLNLDGVIAHGNTDPGILRDAWSLAGLPEAQWRPHLPEVQKAMCRFVERNQSDIQASVLPGVKEVLQQLGKRGAVLGVATGNLAEIGRIKLKRAGLAESFSFGGFSDGFESRGEVFRDAASKARSLTSAAARICVFGDTPADIRAARENSLSVIAVATGIYSFQTLQAERPDGCLHTLQELVEAAP